MSRAAAVSGVPQESEVYVPYAVNVDEKLIDLLRADLLSANYTLSAVRQRIGDEADAARLRGVCTPARRLLHSETSATDALAVLCRAFMLGDALAVAEWQIAFPQLGFEGATQLGLIVANSSGSSEASPTEPTLYRADVSLNPVEISDSLRAEPYEWWVLSDLDDHLRGGPAQSSHVMGVGGATRSLILQAPVDPVSRALDLGTGCGIVALHLALRGPVVATDISARALMFAAANARLNKVSGIELRQGDLFEPVRGEIFDLILSNPPFVVSPRTTDTTYEYRDAGMVGDALAERVVRESAQYLAADGNLLCLANWESPWGTDGLTRVSGWVDEAAAAADLPPHELAAWVLERDRVSPIRYAETWARDGGARSGEPDFELLVSHWMDDFAHRNIVALGLGSIRIRRLSQQKGEQARGHSPIRHTERAAGAFSDRAGIALAAAFHSAIIAESLSDTEVLAQYWRMCDGVSEHRVYQPGHEAPQSLQLVNESGIERRVVADPLLSAAVGASDGDLSLRQITDALGTVLEVDPDAAAEALVSGVRELVWMGMLTL